MKTLPIVTYPFYINAIDGLILKRTANKHINDSGVESFDYNVTRYFEWNGIYDWEFCNMPNLAGDIIGKITGKYRVEYGYNIYEVIPFNHVWSKYGFPVTSLEYKANDNGYFYEMVPDTGDVTGFVVKSHMSRDFSQDFFPNFDPDYSEFSDTEKWDKYFKSPPTRDSNVNFNGYFFKQDRKKIGFEISAIRGTVIEVLLKPFYQGNYLETHGLCLSKTEQLPTKADILHISENPENPIDSYNAKSIEYIQGLEPNTDYFARLYMKDVDAQEYYSGAQTFKTTVPLVIPQYVISATTRELTATTAVLRTQFDFIGDFIIEEAGLIWIAYTSGEPVLPTLASNNGKLTTGVRNEAEMIEYELTGLTVDTKYYVRTYVKLVGVVDPVYGTHDISIQPIHGSGYRHPGYFTTSALVDPVVPIVTILRKLLTDATKTSVSGKIITMGGAALFKAGICWSTSAYPTKANSIVEADMTRGEFAEFYCDVIGLQPETTYHFRSWATTKKGGTEYTGYSADELVFDTTTGVISELTYNTQQATGITSSSAKVAIVINDKGGLTIIESGVCYKLNSSPNNPIITDGKQTLGTDIGRYEATITGLVENTQYKVRSYVTTSEGTVYGNLITFTTLKKSNVFLPSITTNIDVIEGKTTATVKATIESNGGAAILRKGFAWSTSSLYQVDTPLSPYQDVATENIIHTITGLTEDTRYYVRAYAINEKGIGWGREVIFKTLVAGEVGVVPIIVNLPVFELKTTSSVLSARITAKNGTVTRKGIAWSTSSIAATTPTGSYKDHTITADSFSVEINNLSPETLYYVRAYVENETGFGWSSQYTFTTPIQESPVIATSSVIGRTNNSISFELTVSKAVLERGIAWGYAPQTTPNKIKYSAGSGSIYMQFSTQTPGIYYVRPYYTTSEGDTFLNSEKIEVIADDNTLFKLPSTGSFYSFKGRNWIKDAKGIWYRSDKVPNDTASQPMLYQSSAPLPMKMSTDVINQLSDKASIGELWKKVDRSINSLESIEELDLTITTGFYQMNMNYGEDPDDYLPFNWVGESASPVSILVMELMDIDISYQIAFFWDGEKQVMKYRSMSSGSVGPAPDYGWVEVITNKTARDIIASKSENFSITNETIAIVIGVTTVTLPSDALNGRRVIIKCNNESGDENVTIVPAIGKYIDYDSSYVLAYSESVELMAFNTNWIVLSRTKN